MKKTKQGVRDLSHLKGKSVGIKLEMPPSEQMCDHRRRSPQDTYGTVRCLDCPTCWDYEGREF